MVRSPIVVDSEAVRPDARAWFRGRTTSAPTLDAIDVDGLIAAKRRSGSRVSVVLPARDEQATVGVLAGRIPLKAPACGVDSVSSVTPNPCEIQVQHFDELPVYPENSCVQSGTTTELNLADYFKSNNMTFNPVVIEAQNDVNAAVPTATIGSVIAVSATSTGSNRLTDAALPARTLSVFTALLAASLVSGASLLYL